MKIKVITGVLTILLLSGCVRVVPEINFEPETVVTELDLIDKYEKIHEIKAEMYNGEEFVLLDVNSELKYDYFMEWSHMGINIEIPEGAELSSIYVYDEKIYYSYHFYFYENGGVGVDADGDGIADEAEGGIDVPHTEELYTKIMVYDYYTGKYKEILSFEEAGECIFDIRVQDNLITWNRINYTTHNSYEDVYCELYNMETFEITDIGELTGSSEICGFTEDKSIITLTDFYQLDKYDFVNDEKKLIVSDAKGIGLVDVYNDYITYMSYDSNNQSTDVYVYDVNGIKSWFRFNGYVYSAQRTDDIFVAVYDNGNDVYLYSYNFNNQKVYVVNGFSFANYACEGSYIYMSNKNDMGKKVIDTETGSVEVLETLTDCYNYQYNSNMGVYDYRFLEELSEEGNQLIEVNIAF